MSTKDIDLQISKLQAEKNKILRDEEADKLKEFMSLNWIKESTASISVAGMRAYGDNYKVNISLNSAAIPYLRYNTYIPLYKSVCFTTHDNFSFGSEPRYNPRLRAVDVNDVIEFLTKYPFKELHYDLDEAKLLHFLYNKDHA